ncbi:aldehyde dehydrogenase family protein [Streptomyces mobaraensis]|uniref:aldehyde dehydrogenase (NAD(+)) n=1 Tax=Streptomyces mobaraensis TaxID=35621 RepID=A0A5N5VYG1_STRMB|nr:aldehyde dehydrogenase family protein [Streptomyces mobaraensis]KAB7833703.1 aldehyde dehydrogenase family protein [Streptomyces mobaraensis]
MTAYDGMFVDGAWRPARGTGRIEVENPATEEVVASVPAGTAEDVDDAVRAARAALPGWAGTAPARRGAHLTALADALAARQEEIAATVTTELGSPIGFARRVHAGLPVAVARSYAELAATFAFEERIGTSTVLHEPAGLVGAITPWNYPLHQIVAKVAPALAAGCTVVLKPAEYTPLTARLFAECVAAAGLPAGVFNLVTGYGPEAGQPLAEHPDVDLVSFTGSTAVGRRIGALAGGAVKRVALELGGKSANVILPGADLATAVRANVADVVRNAGQSCNALTRTLVHTDHYDEAVALAVEAVAAYVPGDPTDPERRLGPVVSARQRDRVRELLRKGAEEGARVAAGGAEPPEGLDKGYYVRPTVLADVTPDMTVAREEIFGPVLSFLRYRDTEEALRLANDSEYGLSGAVWAADRDEAVAFARRMECGRVDVNGGDFNILAPFGGWKQSGVGRELGVHGLLEYLKTKSLQL